MNQIITDAGVLAIKGPADIPVTHIHSDSRKVDPGSLFIAVRGLNSDGHDFIPQAIASGAAGIVCETLPEKMHPGITYVQVVESGKALGHMASHFYGDPSRKLKLIGVTGTNGKTTTVTLLYRLFLESGFKSGLVSTIVNRIGEKIVPASYTTPDPLTLNELLADMVDQGCTHCFMEVSSHSIDQHRIAGLTFDGGIFTNITHDHLDYHKTFDAYLAAKKSFFDNLPETAFALTNKDDRNGMVMVQNCPATIHTYSLRSMAEFRCKILENQFHGLLLNIDGTECWFRLTGTFNAYNLLVVYATGIIMGLEKQELLTHLSRMEPVPGRFNYFISDSKITAIVDYAHTPDALQNVLETINLIRKHQERLITVVGAGGNRDTSKRPVMAGIACSLSDRLILTSDNPRFEEPEEILNEMQTGIDPGDKNKVLVIVSRKDAIRTACSMAREGDIILVAGKGHETYQEIKGVKYPFDDMEVLKEFLKPIR